MKTPKTKRKDRRSRIRPRFSSVARSNRAELRRSPCNAQFLREQDLYYCERIFNGIVSYLKEEGYYVPALDDPLIGSIAGAAVYERLAETFLDPRSLSADVYVSVSDAQLKQHARLRSAIRELAASRRQRLGRQGSTQLAEELQKIVDEVTCDDHIETTTAVADESAAS